MHSFYNFVLNFYVEPLSSSEAEVDAHSGVERYIKFPNICDEIGDISELFVLDGSIEEVVILILSFPSFVYYAFDGCFGDSQILDCSEIYF